MGYTKFVLTIMTCYAIYYGINILLDLKRAKKEDGTSDEGKEVDITDSLADYHPLPVKEDIGDEQQEWTDKSTVSDDGIMPPSETVDDVYEDNENDDTDSGGTEEEREIEEEVVPVGISAEFGVNAFRDILSDGNMVDLFAGVKMNTATI
jgi:hypothetical protein